MKEPSVNSVESVEEVDGKRVNKAIGYASRLLSTREYSQKMLRDKLKIKGYIDAEIEHTLAFLLENNWLNDARFCESFIRSRVSRGQGWLRIQYELSQKGIRPSLAEDKLTELNVCWQSVCDELTQRKLRSMSAERDLKTRQKLQRFLVYRGFSGSEVRQSITKYFKQTGVSSGEYDE